MVQNQIGVGINYDLNVPTKMLLLATTRNAVDTTYKYIHIFILISIYLYDLRKCSPAM